MPCCVAFGCNTNARNKDAVPPITFHFFPTDEVERMKWVNAVKRENWYPKKTSRLCSKHFREVDFDRSSPFITKLKKGVVPSIFDVFPDHLEAMEKQGEQGSTEQTSDLDYSESGTSCTSREPPKKKIKELDIDPVERQNGLLELACDLLSNVKEEESNECLDIGKVWGTKLMSLDPIQRRFAEKAINDILFEAEMGTLQRNSVQINSNPPDPLAVP